MTQNKFKKIFVGGLPPHTNESDMREYFSKYGEVCDVVAMRDKTGNKSRGFGFVVFKEAESVDRCQAERPHQLLGKVVDTKRAMPKEESINPDIHCNSKRIFIGGLRRFFTEDDLRNYFKVFGQIVDCTIKRDSVSGASRGFAFITFTDRDIVDKVILSKPHSIRHCIVDVKKAMSPEELRQLDENINQHTNNLSEYDIENQKMKKVNQESDDETKFKEKSKRTPRRSVSYPQSDFSNYGYYMLPPELASAATSPVPFPYDSSSHHQQQAQIPLIWMSVQQCPEGLILTPVATDVYNGGTYPPYFYNPSLYHQLLHSPSHHSNINNSTGGTATTDKDNHQRQPLTDCDNTNSAGDTIDVSDLKKSLPPAESVTEDDCASEETAFGSPNSESV